MPRPNKREIEESFERAGCGVDDEAVLRHVLLDDELPQGLHRGGFHEWSDEEYNNIADYEDVGNIDDLMGETL